MNLFDAIQKQINFCQYNEKYKCGIFVKNSERIKIVTEVISYLIQNPSGVIELKKNKCDALVTFRNGSLIRVIVANDGVRGYRWNGLIIDSDISQEIINTIILPRLILLKLEDDQYNSNDNPRDRVYYCSINEDDKNNNQLLYVKNNEQLFYVSSAYNKYQNCIKFCNGNSISFEKEYECMFFNNEYNTAIRTIEKDNNKILVFNALGIPKENIEYKTEFINKSKESYLVIQGKVELKDINYENGINVSVRIDTNIYDGYEVNIEDGLIKVVLHEIINEVPVLKDYGTTPKVN